jgi:hypothetical protein
LKFFYDIINRQEKGLEQAKKRLIDEKEREENKK